MKRTLLNLLVLMLLAFPAQAVIIPTEHIGTAYNDGWWYNAGSSYIGPANRGGWAVGSLFAESWHVNSVEGFMKGWGDMFSPNGTVAFSIYKGSTYGHDQAGPFPGERIWTSDNISVPLNGQTTGYSKIVGLDFEPGQYWFGVNGGSTGLMQVTGYQFEGDSVASQKFTDIHNPEPSTLVMLGGGLLALIRRRKK